MIPGPAIQIIDILDCPGIQLSEVLEGFFHVFKHGLTAPKMFILNKLTCINDLNDEQSTLLGIQSGSDILLEKVMFSNNYPQCGPTFGNDFMLKFMINDRLFSTSLNTSEEYETSLFEQMNTTDNNVVIKINNLKEDTIYHKMHKKYIDTKIMELAP